VRQRVRRAKEFRLSKAYFFMDTTPSAVATTDKREAWMPKNGLPYYDKVARRTFTSRREKRAWLKSNGMRECGELINPEKHVLGREKSHRDPHHAQAIRDYVAAQGGTDGLLKRIQENRGVFV